jgi:glycosyltransferase involved in cell wall biosynthesis
VAHSFRLVEVFHTTTLSTFKQKLQMRAHYPLFARSDLLVYVCNTQREFWHRQHLPARSDAVVYNGIDARRFIDTASAAEKLAMRRSLGFAEHDYVLGLCAVFRPEKAHVDLLEATAALRERGIPAKAVLIGDGPHRAAIEAAIERLRLEQHVRITGYVSDVRPYVAICDVMTLVSHAIETFSIAALECMAMGKPVVMSRVGGAEELVRDGEWGRLYPAGDVQALTQHLAELAQAELRARYGAAAQANVRERFTQERMTQDFTACLLRVCAGDERARFASHASAAP